MWLTGLVGNAELRFRPMSYRLFLAGSGTEVVVPYRCDEHDYRHLRVAGDLGQIQFLVIAYSSCLETSVFNLHLHCSHSNFLTRMP